MSGMTQRRAPPQGRGGVELTRLMRKERFREGLDGGVGAPDGLAGSRPGPASRAGASATYAVALLCVIGAILAADQNLMAPNLTKVSAGGGPAPPGRCRRRRPRGRAGRAAAEPAPRAARPQIARDLGMTDEERDSKLAGWTAAVFFLVGAPASLVAGWADPFVDRVRALFLVVLLGEGPLVLMLFVREYWQLLCIRVMTGVAVGGTLPLVFSLLSDMFPESQRSFVSSLAMMSNGAGLVLGQGIAGALGPALGWRAPFALIGVASSAASLALWAAVPDPPRGAMDGPAPGGAGGGGGEEAAPLVPAPAPGPGRDGRPRRRGAGAGGGEGAAPPHPPAPPGRPGADTWGRLARAWSVPSNALVFLQGVPGSLPWGMMMVFMNDYLAQDQGMGVPRATLVLMMFGVGGGVGTLLGGAAGQWLYNRRAEWMVAFFSAAVLSGTAPVLTMVLADMSRLPLAVPAGLALVGGVVIVVAGPNIRAVTMNVNPPDTLGLALALHATLDDVGRGLGPALVAPMVRALGRRGAFVLATLGWVPCAGMLFALVFTVRRDQARKEAVLRGAGGGGGGAGERGGGAGAHRV